MTRELTISAEVLLQKKTGISAQAAVEKTAGRLKELGLKVMSVGSRSISVQGTKEQFESLFHCQLGPPAKKSSPGLDFGPLGGIHLQAATPLKVPEDLQDEVASIEIQESPLLL